MPLQHPPIDVVRNLIDNREEVHLHSCALTDTDRTTTRLVNNGRIPVLRQKEDAITEL